MRFLKHILYWGMGILALSACAQKSSYIAPESVVPNTPDVPNYIWKNPANPLDVNNDGEETMADLEVLETVLEERGAFPYFPHEILNMFYDVNGDRSVDGNDARIVVARFFRLHNPVLPEDVNGDGVVTEADAQAVINAIAGPGSFRVTPEMSGPPYLDVARDNWVVPLDALRVINYMSRNR
jgi:hypothetical protein